MSDPGRSLALAINDAVEIDTRARLIRTARTFTNTLVIGDADQPSADPNTLEMLGADLILLQLSMELDALSTVTEVRFRVRVQGDDGWGYLYQADPQAFAPSPIDTLNVADQDQGTPEWVFVVAAGTDYYPVVEIPIHHRAVEIAAWADAAGHANDLFGITALRRVTR